MQGDFLKQLEKVTKLHPHALILREKDLTDEEYEKESVIKVGQDSTYIIAQTNMDRYYILDTKEESVLEFKSEYEFNLKKKELGISEDVSLESLGKYKKE